MKEFFGWGGFEREPEGYLSWQHLVFVTSLMIIMVGLAIFLGRKYKDSDIRTKNRVLIISAILIDSLEILKIVLRCAEHKSAMEIFYVLPLFLCSIQLITIPLAAFSKGRLKNASLDFVFVFGLLGAVLGTYGAGNNYSCYPVLSFPNVVSGLTHTIAGFCALYIVISGMASMKKRNIWITYTIFGGFCVAAYIANIFTDCNYMFLTRGDGTPYDIFYNMVSGNQVAYPIIVVMLFVAYIAVFYYVYFLVCNKVRKKKAQAMIEE